MILLKIKLDLKENTILGNEFSALYKSTYVKIILRTDDKLIKKKRKMNTLNYT